MPHTKERIASWILNRWADDYYRFDDVKAGFKVISFECIENSLLVKMSFIGDESKKGNDSDSIIMFRFDPENHEGFFPVQLQIITLEEKYEWDNALSCSQLEECRSEETINIEVEYIDWSDPRISDEELEVLVYENDQYALAETLINLYEANIKMPDFVPQRLHTIFKKMMADFQSN
jgi:hypothetical protein